MHLHYFQHDNFEDLGYIGEWANSHGISTSVTRFDLNPELPTHESYDWLVVMGGKMSVNDQVEFTWLEAEIAFIKEAIRLGKTVIGICLGAQLIAKASGSTVYKNIGPEMGFWPVRFSQNASKDKVFRHFPNELLVLHVHFDTYKLPEGAVNMAESAITNSQAYRNGENVFGFQFHFEVTPQNISGFLNGVEPELVEGEFSQSKAQMLELSNCCSFNNSIFGKVLDEILLMWK
jgi:GMP synthase-like glutamine amidotransferase